MAFRTHNFSLRLTSLEVSNYERLAKDNGVPVSEWMRNVLNAEVNHKEDIVSLARSYSDRGYLENFMTKERKERTE